MIRTAVASVPRIQQLEEKANEARVAQFFLSMASMVLSDTPMCLALPKNTALLSRTDMSAQAQPNSLRTQTV